MATWPVRTTSIKPSGRSTSSRLSILSSVPVISMVSESCATSTTRARNTLASSSTCERESGVGCHLDQREIARDGRLRGHVVHQQHVHQLVDVGHDSARLVFVRIHDDRHPRDFRFFGAAHGERVDIERAPAEQRNHAREHARLIFDVNDECMEHGFSYSSPAVSTIGLGRRIISCSEAPAATIG